MGNSLHTVPQGNMGKGAGYSKQLTLLRELDHNQPLHRASSESISPQLQWSASKGVTCILSTMSGWQEHTHSGGWG